MSSDCQVEGISTVHAGQWLDFDHVNWKDKAGRQRVWERVSRHGGTQAAIAVATIVQDGRIILVRQFRPAMGKYAIEFPAGLIDAGESASQTAVRELREETGYVGEVVLTCGATCVSPGLTDEKVSVVVLTVDLEQPQNKEPTQHLEAGENMDVLLMTREDIVQMLESLPPDVEVDTKVLFLALGFVAP